MCGALRHSGLCSTGKNEKLIVVTLQFASLQLPCTGRRRRLSWNRKRTLKRTKAWSRWSDRGLGRFPCGPISRAGDFFFLPRNKQRELKHEREKITQKPTHQRKHYFAIIQACVRVHSRGEGNFYVLSVPCSPFIIIWKTTAIRKATRMCS